ncbi:MAG: ATP-binding protein [Bacteroidaceae bacterium]
MVFRRKIYGDMIKWKNEQKGETALLVEGARRIGKSTIVEEFAKREYDSYMLIDFSVASPEVIRRFDDLSDIDDLFTYLQFRYKVTLKAGRSVVIFDEVQMAPKARQAIKHLVKDGRYQYIETGSLISIRRNVLDIVIPSEETRLEMFPMDYEEFRWALGDEATVELLRQSYAKMKPMGDDIHRQMMRSFRLYMLVGGMPQAVAKYIETRSLAEVDRVKRNIIALYGEDFRKLDTSGRSGAMFHAIPGQLSRNVSRYQVGNVIKGEKPGRVVEAVSEMNESFAVNVAYHCDDPNVGMALTRDMERYKMYVADTGLCVTLAFCDKKFTDNVIYDKLLGDKLSVNLGYIYENVVAQMLRSNGHRLFYHTFLREDGKNYYEVDFLLSDGAKLKPVEVKSSGYKSHVSIDRFAEKFSNRVERRYIVYTKDLKKDGNTLYLPVYMAMFL